MKTHTPIEDSVGKTVTCVKNLFDEYIIIVFDDNTYSTITGYVELYSNDICIKNADMSNFWYDLTLVEMGIMSEEEYDTLCTCRKKLQADRKKYQEMQTYQRLHAKYGKEN